MSSRPSFQSLIRTLQDYWGELGCATLVPYDMEMGAGTFHPATVLKCLGPKPWRCSYVQPSRRPADCRFGLHPNRLYKHHQMQVLLKPAPADIQQLYLTSLGRIGIDTSKHDIRFVEDDWESPTLGASGLGWEAWCDGMEVTQFTYIQKMGSIDCEVVSGEITYGLERISMYIQNKDNVYDLDYNSYTGPNQRISYGDVCQQSEREFSEYSVNTADVPLLFDLFNCFETECQKLLEFRLPLPAYDFCMKCSHVFNTLDSRGAISVTERAHYIARVRGMARRVCEVNLEVESQSI